MGAQKLMLEETVFAANEMLERAIFDVLLEAAANPDTALGCALKRAVAAAADTTFRELVEEAAEQLVVGQPGQVRTRTGGAGRCLRHGDLRGVRNAGRSECARGRTSKRDRL